MSDPIDDTIDRGNPLAAVAEEGAERVNYLREFAKERIENFLKRGLHILYAYDGNRDMAFDCFMFALGEGENIGLKSAVEIGRKHRVEKATATKCIKMFQDSLDIEGMPGQRSDKGRSQMSKARKDQLK